MIRIIERLEELVDTWESEGTLGDEKEVAVELKELVDLYYEEGMYND